MEMMKIMRQLRYWILHKYFKLKVFEHTIFQKLIGTTSNNEQFMQFMLKKHSVYIRKRFKKYKLINTTVVQKYNTNNM